ncbi:MAG: 30S ribosomal protein S1 [Planctomycetota bacterium]
MLQRDILADLDIDKTEINEEVAESLKSIQSEDLETELDESVQDFSVNTVLTGKVVNIGNDEVMVDVGYKSEGVVPLYEWDDPESIEVGDEVEVLLEAVEDESGVVQLSKQKAEQIRAWEKITNTYDEGDIVTGQVIRKIKGGLLVDIGVPVFLPASQVDIRRPGEIADYIGQDLTCKILKIDEGRRNIVVSRRQLIEQQREVMATRLLPKLEAGEVRMGKVKNIVDFGAFVDLGGVDGLLHITDMSWGRISHPSEMVGIDDEIMVKILSVDEDEGKIALGLKQKTASPWDDIEDKYPVGSTVTGEVVNLMSYGAFVKLEEGVEGLVHISEMSWTNRINHPSEVVSIGDEVDVVVLDIDTEKEQISLGMKQTEQNPWEAIKEKYPPGSTVSGEVRNLTSYGAFVEIEDGIDGLLHVNDMSWTHKVNHPSEMVNKGETIETMILKVDAERRRVALGIKQLEPDPWQEEIPDRYRTGDVVRGQISKLTSFGAFVKLEEDLEGLLHVSEMSKQDIESPEEIVAEGDIVDVRVLRVDTEERKIGLSLLPVPGREDEEPGPGIVVLADEIEEAEDPDEVVREAMAEAPQLEERPERPSADGVSGSGLNIPQNLGSSQEQEETPTEEKEVSDSEEEEQEATEAAAEPTPADSDGGDSTSDEDAEAEETPDEEGAEAETSAETETSPEAEEPHSAEKAEPTSEEEPEPETDEESHSPEADEEPDSQDAEEEPEDATDEDEQA